MKLAGIDYSMTSPGMVIGDTNDHSKCMFYGIRQKKKQVSIAPNVILFEPNDSYTCSEERYFILAQNFLQVILLNEIKHVYIEGYSYGSTGNTFSIGENTAILKFLLWQEGIQVSVLQPSEIKKFATEKGNANKVAMTEAFELKTGCRLDKLIDDERTIGKPIPAPVSDMIDAYWILQLGLSKE